MTIAHPLPHAWLSTGGTGAQNYDEFADDAEITAIIAANPASALGDRDAAPRAGERRPPFADALPAAAERLAAAKRDGHYAGFDDVAVVYRITVAGRHRRATGSGAWSTPIRSPPRPTSPVW